MWCERGSSDGEPSELHEASGLVDADFVSKDCDGVAALNGVRFIAGSGTRGGEQSGCAVYCAYLPCHVLGAPAQALGSVAVAVARKGLAPHALRLPEQTEVKEHDCDHAGVGGEDDAERVAAHRVYHTNRSGQRSEEPPNSGRRRPYSYGTVRGRESSRR